MLENNLTLGMTMGVGLVALSFVLFWALKGMNAAAKHAVMWWLGLRPAPQPSTFAALRPLSGKNGSYFGRTHRSGCFGETRGMKRVYSMGHSAPIGIVLDPRVEPKVWGLKPQNKSHELGDAIQSIIGELKTHPPENMASPERFIEVLEEWYDSLEPKEGGGPCPRPEDHERRM